MVRYIFRAITIVLIIILILVGLRLPIKKCSLKDYNEIGEIVLSREKPTFSELLRFDLNRDGIINSSDYVICAKEIRK